MAVLPDVLQPGLRVVFCGTAVGNRTAWLGQYYAGRGNRFWAVLHRVGLTPVQLTPPDWLRLPDFGIGLTDLVKGVSGNDRALERAHFDMASFRSRIEAVAPAVVAFNGKRAGQAFLDRPVEYGRQREMIGQTVLFVLPSTSGAAGGWWDEGHWRELAAYLGSHF